MQKNILNFLYGTAWKEERTAELVELALSLGFKGIDTANQRKHYFEEAVGIGLNNCYKKLSISRDDIFLQTKYTYAAGQDHRMPYDSEASFSNQVLQSFESSLIHLDTDYIDSYVLHGPYYQDVFSDIDIEVWQAMEQLVVEGRVINLGISNISYDQLLSLYSTAKTKPKFVQNRCFAQMGWDKKIRDFCSDKKIVYQGFSLLTANQLQINHPSIKEICITHGKTKEQVILRFSQQMGMLPLTGTTSKHHMIDDLSITDFNLLPEEIKIIENINK